MFNIYFGNWGDGKLQRLPYLGYYVLLMVLVMLILFGGIFAIGATETMMSGNLADIQQLLTNKLGFVALFGIIILFFAVFIGQVNIFAKRIRDMGLPVLWTITAIVIVSIVLNVIFPPHEVAISAASVQTANSSVTTMAAHSTSSSMVTQAFDMFVFLCLLFIPSNTFRNKNRY